MKKIKIKNTDLTVSQISYGTTKLGVDRTLDEDFALLDAFIDAGGNFIDTARIYSDWIPGEVGRSERVLGEWLKARNYPKDLVIATKGAHPELRKMDVSRIKKEDVERDITLSLKALGIETIDLYYLHRDDPSVSVSHIIDYLEDFKARGYLRYYACSNWSVDRIADAQEYAASKGYMGFSVNEMYWNLATSHMREPNDATLVKMDAKMYDLHKATGLCAVPYSSQAGGYFTKIISDTRKAIAMPYHTEENERRAKELARRFKDAKTPMQYVLGYFANRPFQVIPAFGASNMQQLKDTLYAIENPLRPDIEL